MTTTEDQTFGIEDLTLFIKENHLCTATAANPETEEATAMYLIIANQKNDDTVIVSIAHAQSAGAPFDR